MDAQQLRERATQLREIARVVKDDEVRTAALEMAMEYEQEACDIAQSKQRTREERPRL